MKKNTVILAFISLGLFACSSNQKKPPKVNELFIINIKENGSKVFNYSLIADLKNSPRKSGGRGGKGGSRSGGMGRGGMGGGGMSKGGRGQKPGGRNNENREKMKDKLKDRAYSKLDNKLHDTGYCREGFFEIDGMFDRGQAVIQGECNETASKTDRENFINNESY